MSHQATHQATHHRAGPLSAVAALLMVILSLGMAGPAAAAGTSGTRASRSRSARRTPTRAARTASARADRTARRVTGPERQGDGNATAKPCAGGAKPATKTRPPREATGRAKNPAPWVWAPTGGGGRPARPTRGPCPPPPPPRLFVEAAGAGGRRKRQEGEAAPARPPLVVAAGGRGGPAPHGLPSGAGRTAVLLAEAPAEPVRQVLVGPSKICITSPSRMNPPPGKSGCTQIAAKTLGAASVVTFMALSVATNLIEAWVRKGTWSRSRAADRYVARADSTAAAMSASTNASPWWSMIFLPKVSRSLA